MLCGVSECSTFFSEAPIGEKAKDRPKEKLTFFVHNSMGQIQESYIPAWESHVLAESNLLL